MARCRRRASIQRLVLATPKKFTLGLDTVAFTLRAVDSTGAPVAFTIALGTDTSNVFHMAAGEAYQADELKLDQELDVTVTGSAATDVGELLTWEA